MGVVAGSDEGSGFDVAEAHAKCLGFELGEFARRVEAGHGKVIARRTQVLADGEDVAADCGEVAKDGEEFVGFFAETDHDARFCYAGGVEFFGVTQQLKRTLITSTRTDDSIQARNGFGVVIENFWLRVDDNPDCLTIALEVGNEDLDATAGRLTSDLIDDHGEDASTADQVIITVDAGDDSVCESEGGDGFGNAAGFVEVDGLGTAFGNGAESAASGAEIAEHHECRRFVMPAFADVGALSAFADGVKAERAGEALEGVVVFAHRGTGLQPFRFGSGGAVGGLDLDQVHLCLL